MILVFVTYCSSVSPWINTVLFSLQTHWYYSCCDFGINVVVTAFSHTDQSIPVKHDELAWIQYIVFRWTSAATSFLPWSVQKTCNRLLFFFHSSSHCLCSALPYSYPLSPSLTLLSTQWKLSGSFNSNLLLFLLSEGKEVLDKHESRGHGLKQTAKQTILITSGLGKNL